MFWVNSKYLNVNLCEPCSKLMGEVKQKTLTDPDNDEVTSTPNTLTDKAKLKQAQENFGKTDKQNESVKTLPQKTESNNIYPYFTQDKLFSIKNGLKQLLGSKNKDITLYSKTDFIGILKNNNINEVDYDRAITQLVNFKILVQDINGYLMGELEID